MKGPPITVACECGTSALVEYPSTWECEECGRRWNTGQIPEDEYWGIMDEMKRFRFEAIRSALILGAVIVTVSILLSKTFFFLVPIVFSGWYLFYMPRWRRRVRAVARSTPNWNLHPE